MEDKRKDMDKDVDLTYEEWVSGGRYKYAEEMYTSHGNGD